MSDILCCWLSMTKGMIFISWLHLYQRKRFVSVVSDVSNVSDVSVVSHVSVVTQCLHAQCVPKNEPHPLAPHRSKVFISRSFCAIIFLGEVVYSCSRLVQVQTIDAPSL